MPYSPDPILELFIIDPLTEEDTWAVLLNTNQKRLAEAAHGIVLKDIAPGTTSITLDDTDYTGTESHKAGIYLSGVMTANVEIVLPAGRQHSWKVFNNTSSSVPATPRLVTFRVPNSSESVVLSHGEKTDFLVYGTSFWQFYSSKKTVLTDGSNKMLAPLDMGGQTIRNLPHPASAEVYDAAPIKWVADYIESRVSTIISSRIEALLPVGCLFSMGINPANPVVYFGFGTWVPWGGGTFRLCAGAHTDPQGTTRAYVGVGEKIAIGVYTNVLQQANLPPNIQIPTTTPNDNTGGNTYIEASGVGPSGTTTIALGSGVPILNEPPFSVEYVWRRVA